jgi:uncharacterized membrane protein
MVGMSRRRLRRIVDADKVKAAIEEAEHMTSGEVRVSVSHFFWGSVHRTAERAFTRLGMDRTRHRNGVLIFVVPSRRRFSIIGDEGIHQHVGQEFWDAVAARLSENFKKGDFTEGLVEAVEEVGRRLKVHFPYTGEKDPNEIPDDVDFDGEKE